MVYVLISFNWLCCTRAKVKKKNTFDRSFVWVNSISCSFGISSILPRQYFLAIPDVYNHLSAIRVRLGRGALPVCGCNAASIYPLKNMGTSWTHYGFMADGPRTETGENARLWGRLAKAGAFVMYTLNLAVRELKRFWALCEWPCSGAGCCEIKRSKPAGRLSRRALRAKRLYYAA